MIYILLYGAIFEKHWTEAKDPEKVISFALITIEISGFHNHLHSQIVEALDSLHGPPPRPHNKKIHQSILFMILYSSMLINTSFTELFQVKTMTILHMVFKSKSVYLCLVHFSLAFTVSNRSGIPIMACGPKMRIIARSKQTPQ